MKSSWILIRSLRDDGWLVAVTYPVINDGATGRFLPSGEPIQPTGPSFHLANGYINNTPPNGYVRNATTHLPTDMSAMQQHTSQCNCPTCDSPPPNGRCRSVAPAFMPGSPTHPHSLVAKRQNDLEQQRTGKWLYAAFCRFSFCPFGTTHGFPPPQTPS
jgi:hypothetical protein